VAAQHLPIRCRCGAVRGSLVAAGPAAGNHVICYCDDCQAFAYALGRAGDVLDACGGSEIVQVSPARIRFEAGAEKLSCLRLTAKGPLRWYTSCCNTPIGNTLASGAVPFIGMLCACLEAPRDARADSGARVPRLRNVRAELLGARRADVAADVAFRASARAGTPARRAAAVAVLRRRYG
jgi:hypothetical protein